MIDGRNVFDQPVKDDIKSYKTLVRLPQVKEMIGYLFLVIIGP